MNGASFGPVGAPHRHTSLVARVPNFFESLEMGATLVDAHGWHAVYASTGLLIVELEYGVETLRHAYNQRCMDEALRREHIVVGRHAGLCDLFVPIRTDGRVDQMLIAGPFRDVSLDSGEIYEQWRRLTGRQGHLVDPAFASYVKSWLETPYYGGADLASLERWMRVFGDLISAERPADDLYHEMRKADGDLAEACFVHRMWRAARDMLDLRSSRSWSSAVMRNQRLEIEVPRVPEHALVALIASRFEAVDPVDDLVRRHEFQRACVGLARRRRAATAPVGDYGVAILLPPERSASRSLDKLHTVAEQVAALGRRPFGLRVHVGLGPVTGGAALPARYHQALAAAEKALSKGSRVERSPVASARPPSALRDLLDELARLPAATGRQVGASFERYSEAVTVHSGYRVDATQARLEAGFEAVVAALLAKGVVGRAAVDEVYGALDRDTEAVRTLEDLLATYRNAVAQLEVAVARPTQAHRERSLERALTYIRDHVTEPLRLDSVARVAGFEPHYFSRVFRMHEGVTFEQFVTDLRTARARQMLLSTSLNVERVAQLCGFRSGHYFHRVFKRITGETPLNYRRRLGWSRKPGAALGRW